MTSCILNVIGILHSQVLKNVFGHNEVKTKQWEAIRSVNNYKRDCFVNAYAGYGKSLIYQFLPVFLNKIGVIISPLMSLIEDQVFSLKEKNIKVGILNYLDCNENISEFNIVYVTPEYYVANNCQDACKIQNNRNQTEQCNELRLLQ